MSDTHGWTADELLRVVSPCRHRQTLRYLRANDLASVTELAAAIDDHCRHSQGLPAEVSQLQHNVLPKLEERGLLEYDRRSNAVRDRTPELVGDVLEWIGTLEDRLES